MSPWVRRSGIVMWLMVTWAGPTLAIEPDRVRTILAEATYTMADQDTLAAAEQSTLLRAERNAVEQAGVYLESTFTDTASSTSSLAVQRSSLAIRAISAAILRTEVLERKVAVDHGRPVFWSELGRPWTCRRSKKPFNGFIAKTDSPGTSMSFDPRMPRSGRNWLRFVEM